MSHCSGFGLYDEAVSIGLDEARSLLELAGGETPASVNKPAFDMDRQSYTGAFDRVRDHLAKGDIYQVNLTMRAPFAASRPGGEPVPGPDAPAAC